MSSHQMPLLFQVHLLYQHANKDHLTGIVASWPKCKICLQHFPDSEALSEHEIIQHPVPSSKSTESGVAEHKIIQHPVRSLNNSESEKSDQPVNQLPVSSLNNYDSEKPDTISFISLKAMPEVLTATLLRKFWPTRNFDKHFPEF